MPRTEEQNQRLKEERRRALLEAARRVFARKGLAASKMTDLAAAAGISYGLVYHYFPDKEAVFTALVEESVQQGIQLVARARERPGSAWEQLQWLSAQMLDGVQREPSFPLILVQAHASESVPASVEKSLTRYTAHFFEQLVALIEAGQAAGQVVRTPAAELAWVWLATIQGLALMHIVPQPGPRPLPAPATLLRLFAP
jgi:AcrR family transcriptional regulator